MVTHIPLKSSELPVYHHANFRLPIVDTNLRQTHSNALERAARSSTRSTPAASPHRPVRPVWRIGQTGASGRRRKSKPRAREGPRRRSEN